MSPMARLLMTGLWLPLVAAPAAGPQPDTIPSTELIVEHMAAAREDNRARLRSFEVVRSYKLFGKEPQKTKSEVMADIGYSPAGVEYYTIHKINGHPLGEVIVRKILERESEVLTKPESSDLSPENYAFEFLREESLDGQRCFSLALRPLRKDARLLKGIVWVDASTYRILRIDGTSQASSWWVHNVHLVLDFREVNGMWLQTAFHSTADVRFLGPHSMVSKDVEYRMSDTEVALAPSPGPQ